MTQHTFFGSQQQQIGLPFAEPDVVLRHKSKARAQLSLGFGEPPVVQQISRLTSAEMDEIIAISGVDLGEASSVRQTWIDFEMEAAEPTPADHATSWFDSWKRFVAAQSRQPLRKAAVETSLPLSTRKAPLRMRSSRHSRALVQLWNHAQQ